MLINRYTIENFQQNKGYDIIIIAGQSNSVGRGIEEHNFPKTPTGMNPQTLKETINMYKDDYHGSNGKINNLICALNIDLSIKVGATEPIQHQEEFPYKFSGTGMKEGKTITNNFGFAFSFAREYIRQGRLEKGRKILLVGCGKGQTSFKSGRWMSPNGSLYKGTIERAKEAFKKNDIGNNNRFVAILWHQGESDIKYPENYRENLSNSLNGIRNNIQQNNPQDIPILLGGLTNEGNTKAEERARERFTRDNIKEVTTMKGNINFKFIPSDDSLKSATYNGYNLFNHDLLSDKFTEIDHFSKSSQIEFGKRYFYVFNNNKFDTQN